ncbi:MAG: Wzz/FepE/Etk N-terminal domain-containing protein [Bacteroidales bacterium]|nr:Wzz/FepE/Etk N-terminal domain-containing protein [Bacteroidales bacterium]
MESYFNNKKEIRILFKWKKHIVITSLIAGIVGVVISYFIEPKYESIAIVFPANVLPYSEESETEQLLQIFQSSDVRNAVIEDQNLYLHYDIPKGVHLSTYYMKTKWDNNISISRTPNDAIKIRVLDWNAQKACNIANSIINEFNLFTRELHRIKFEEAAELYNRQRERKFAMLDSLKREIKKYNEMGIYDIPYQSKELAAAVLRGSGNTAKIAEMQKAFNEHSGDYMILTAWLAGEVRGLEDFINRYDVAFNRYDRQFTHASVVSSPEVSEKRHFPVRWIFGALFTLGGFLMTLLTIGIIETLPKKELLT